jgi:membrane protein DedA with SNARE-associated domain
VIPGVAGMLGMPWGRFSLVNVISAFIWAAAHIVPGILLGAWLESIGLKIDQVIIVGSIVVVIGAIAFHYGMRFFRKPKTEPPAT